MKAVDLVTVDPGVHAMGVAYWHSGELTRAVYVEAPSKKVGSAAGAVLLTNPLILFAKPPLIVERPKIYQKKTTRQSDIEMLLISVGALVGLWPGAVSLIYPAAWKGQVNPDVMCERVETRLSQNETCVIECRLKSKRHNVLDAIGIGLKTLGRL